MNLSVCNQALDVPPAVAICPAGLISAACMEPGGVSMRGCVSARSNAPTLGVPWCRAGDE